MKSIKRLQTMLHCQAAIFVVGLFTLAGCAGVHQQNVTAEAQPGDAPLIESNLKDAIASPTNTDQSMIITNYQLRVSVRVSRNTNSTELHMTLYGAPETTNSIANRGGIYFVEDSVEKLNDPLWLPNRFNDGNNYIGLYYHRRDFPLITEILRHSNRPRCYYSYTNGTIDAGIKDWANHTLILPALSSTTSAAAEQARPTK